VHVCIRVVPIKILRGLMLGIPVLCKEEKHKRAKGILRIYCLFGWLVHIVADS